MKVIGITGPTGAGKTTVLQEAAALGGVAIDCDAVYHELLAGYEPLQAALVARFGTCDRKKIAAEVFEDPAALQELGAITHHFVIEQVEARIKAAREAGAPLVAIDAIALVESGLAARCDAVIAVLSDKRRRIARIQTRDGIEQSQAARRANAQRPDEFYRENATHVIENNDTQETLAAAARTLLTDLIG